MTETLKKARSLIEKGWCQDLYVTRQDGPPVGIPVAEQDLEGCRFCISGALYQASGASSIWSTFKIAAEIERLGFISEDDVVKWNDDRFRTKEEVLKLFDDAIGR